MTDVKIYQNVYANSYFDSVTLMRLSTELNQLPGVYKVSVMMGTPANLALMAEQGLWDREKLTVQAVDMCVAVQYDNDEHMRAVQLAVEEFVKRGGARATSGESKSLNGPVSSWKEGANVLPDPKVAVISVPGPYAAVESKRALDAGFHVFLFSDNVELEDEVLLKHQAETQGLIVMGPDCGTSLLHGIHLGFVNHVSSGSVGIVAASGTGAQEVSSALDRAGVGISHIIGTGGRDLSEEVGGISARQGLNWLAQDGETDRILLISKPPADSVAKMLLDELRRLGKPAAVLFLGSFMTTEDPNIRVCSTLGEIIAWATGRDMETVPDVPRAKAPFIRALYVGGTFAYQAAGLLGIDSHNHGSKPWLQKAHAVVDFGDDQYTLGRPHPMIDGSLRQEAIEETLLDPATGVVVCDVVLGDGAEENPAGRVADAVVSARTKRSSDDFPIVLAHVVGTRLDPQGFDGQMQRLHDAGIYVTETSTAAVVAALSSIQ